tara:strand:- start:7227 stop:8765 length:1539 start_codon:yes stop_codon:yes gene_type:complete
MKPVMSFWSKPYQMGLHNKWINDKAFRLSWALSVKAVTESHEKPVLYTDEEGKKLLVDEYGLEFAEVNVCLDSALADVDPAFSSASRYYVMTQEAEPFFHIDYDMFLWDALPEDTVTQDVIFQAQCVFDNTKEEFNTFQSALHRPDEMSKIVEVDDYWKEACKNNMFRSYSCSLVGGNDIMFLNLLGREAMAYANKFSVEERKAFDASCRSSYPEDAILAEYASQTYTTIAEFLPFALALREEKKPVFMTNEFGMHCSKFTHVSYAKSRNEEVYGMMIKRLLLSDDLDASAFEVKQSKVPKVSIVIIPNDQDSLYDCVLRSIVPRKLAPDEVIVVDNGIRVSERKFLDRLENVRVAEASPVMTEPELMRFASKEVTGDLVIFISSHVKVPRLYIEKSIAAHLQYPNAAFCGAANEFSDYQRHEGFAYGGHFDGKSPVKPDVSQKECVTREISNVDCLYGGLYIMPRGIMEEVFSVPQNSIEYISTFIKEHEHDLRCIKNMLVSQNFKRAASA